MTSEYFDAVVVGASLAGCTAATLYARQGLSVALVEAHRDINHHKRACTHFIQPTAMPTIRRLGLDGPIEDAGGERNSLETWTRWGWLRSEARGGDTPDDSGYNIRRAVLDPLFRARTVAEPGVTFLPGHSVSGLVRTGSRVVGVVTNSSGGGRAIMARLVVGADGRNSRVAQRAGVPSSDHAHGRFVYFAAFENVGLPNRASRIWMLEPDIGYAFPNGDVTILSVMPSKEKLPEFRKNLQDNYLAFLNRLPDGPDLSAARQLTDLSGVLNYACVSRRPTAPGLALVGDAAMTSDYLWGTGCGNAFQSAEWLVDATADALHDGGDLNAALDRYRIRHHATLSGHHRLMNDYAGGRGFNPVERLIFSAAVRDRKVGRHVQQFGERRISVKKFLSPTILWRSALVNARMPGSRPAGSVDRAA